MSVSELDRRVPPMATHCGPCFVETAYGMAKSVYSKYEHAAKELYASYEPKAEQCAVSAWKKLNQLPLFPRLAQVAVPTATFLLRERVQSLIVHPTERISKIFAEEKTVTEPLEFQPLD